MTPAGLHQTEHWSDFPVNPSRMYIIAENL